MPVEDYLSMIATATARAPKAAEWGKGGTAGSVLKGWALAMGKRFKGAK